MKIESVKNINEIHEKFSEYGRNAKEWQRKCALLLGDIEKFEVWKKKGFLSIYIYAAKLAGMNKFQVDEALRIFRKIEDKPALLAVAEKKGLYAVRPVANVATVETDKYWAKYAKEMPKNELEMFVKNSKDGNAVKVDIGDDNNTFCDSDLSTHKEKILMMRVKPEVATKLEKFYQGDWNALMEKLIELYEKDLDRELQNEKPEPVVNASKHMPQKIENYVLKRSHGKCEFPGCDKNYDHFHHANRYASNRVHDPDKIVALCEAHHGLAHKGLIDHEEKLPKNWKIRKEPDYTNLNWFVDEKIQFFR